MIIYHIVVNGRDLVFEKNVWQDYRVLSTDGDTDHLSDEELMEEIIASLQQIAKWETAIVPVIWQSRFNRDNSRSFFI